jgi:Zn-dependent peptidase ImmA (M78 family)
MSHDLAPITPGILRWAREAAGYTTEVIAKKTGVKPETVEAWEDGTKPLTVGRLDTLSHIYKRPTAIFYLAEPPAEEDVRKAVDFRAGNPGKPPSLLYQLRHARERRVAAVDLAAEAGIQLQPFELSCKSSESHAEVGRRLRSWLGVEMNEQELWSKDASGYMALNGWKDAIERKFVLIFQAGKADLGTCRGFSVSADVYPVIVTNSVDVAVSRCFTLMHELAHLGLRQGGLCDMHDGGQETFCNRVAAATLMPATSFPRPNPDLAENDPNFRVLARKYSVSEQALVLRMLDLGLVDEKTYRRLRAAFDMRNAQARDRKDSEEKNLIIPQHTKAIARNGRAFTQLVLAAYHRHGISGHRASRYLDVSFRFLGEIERDIARRATRAAS